jgi:hypothetical protein
MEFNEDYQAKKWQDEIVDESTGETLVEGTLFDEVNMNRMEAGIDLQNTTNAFVALLAQQTRSNFLELEKWKNQRNISG